MILGYVDDRKQPKVELRVIGNASQMDISFVVDTGFDGSLCLPVETAVPLGLQLKGMQEVEYADGSVKRELMFWGKVLFEGKEEEVDVFLTDSTEALLGTQLVGQGVLVIDFVRKVVEITGSVEG